MIHEEKILGDKFKLYSGDCLEVLKTLVDNSVDSVVTDPPAGISFMGKEWDHHKGGRNEWVKWMSDVMSECLRVLKPGGHALVWAIPRTSHWTATALEDAGFEIRDVICHLFGSGFPKSLDISKAIDKAAGAERIDAGPSPFADKGRTKTRNSFGGGELTASANERLTIAATPAAKQWSGWGTALKPASEHWILVRKPCSEKTVAANVLRWGTGGLNIDASRIEAADQAVLDAAVKRMTGNARNNGAFQSSKSIKPNSSQGRFPANLVLSHSTNCTDDACDMWDCPVSMLDEQSLAGGMHSAGKQRLDTRPKGYSGKGMFPMATEGSPRVGDSGGASRFFYVAKASKSDKNAGCEGLPLVQKSQIASKDGGGGGWSKDTEKNPNLPRANHHPTVKSTKLMSYLIRMVTPPNGVVLDPFTGSGSTGVAALKEGFKFIGIEREPEYHAIAQKRIEHEEAKWTTAQSVI